jgi:drug/metabolite transporter (DMT)-like permease
MTRVADPAPRARATPLEFVGARPVFAAVCGAGAIAFSALLVRLSGVSPTTAAVFRCAYALPILGVLAAVESRRFGPRTRAEHRLAIGAGLFFAADLVMWHHSIEAVGAGLATVLGNMQVLVVALIAWVVLHEKPGARVFASIPVVFAGVVLVSGALGTHAYGRNPGLGVAFGAGTSLAYAGFILLLRHGAKDLRRPAGPLFEATAVTAIAAAVFGALTGDVRFAPAWPAHGWLIILAVTAQVIGWLFLSVSLPRLPAALVSVLLLLQPVGAMALGAIVLSEAPSGVQLSGVALIMAGVVTATWRRRASEPEGING